MHHKPDIDDLIKTIVQEEGLDSPSNGFLDKVMGTVRETNGKVNVYKPLIPKYILTGIFSLVILFVIASGYQQLVAGNSHYLDSIVNGIKILHFNLEMPADISYILISALIMIMIQTVVISTLYKRMHR